MTRMQFPSLSLMIPVEGSKNISPFCTRSRARVPALPLLTSQTNLLSFIEKPRSLVSQMELVPQRRQQGPPVRQDRHCLRSTPYPSMSRIRVAFNIQVNPSDLSQVADDNTGGPDSALIPKPPGEVTRVNRGGYNLDDTLGWAPEILDGLKVGPKMLGLHAMLTLQIEISFCSHRQGS